MNEPKMFYNCFQKDVNLIKKVHILLGVLCPDFILTLSLSQVIKTEFLLTILIQYQAGR